VHPVAFAARELANQLLLVGAPKVEAGAVGAAVHLARAQLDGLIPVGDLLVDGAFAIEMIPVLIDVGHLHGGADSDLPRVGAAHPARAVACSPASTSMRNSVVFYRHRWGRSRRRCPPSEVRT
jgi:hypothetical protein